MFAICLYAFGGLVEHVQHALRLFKCMLYSCRCAPRAVVYVPHYQHGPKMKNFLLSVALILCLPAQAEILTLELPEHGKLSVDVPALLKTSEKTDEHGYQYHASSFPNPNIRYSLSVFIEKEKCQAAKTHQEVGECFIAKMQANAQYALEVKGRFCMPTYCMVAASYKDRATGKLLPHLHGHLLFAYRGGWADVHFAVLTPDEKDAALLSTFSKSLTYSE